MRRFSRSCPMDSLSLLVVRRLLIFFIFTIHLLNEALTHTLFTFNHVGKDTGCIRGPKVSPRDKDVFYFEVAILYMPPSDLG